MSHTFIRPPRLRTSSFGLISPLEVLFHLEVTEKGRTMVDSGRGGKCRGSRWVIRLWDLQSLWCRVHVGSTVNVLTSCSMSLRCREWKQLYRFRKDTIFPIMFRSFRLPRHSSCSPV